MIFIAITLLRVLVSLSNDCTHYKAKRESDTALIKLGGGEEMGAGNKTDGANLSIK